MSTKSLVIFITLYADNIIMNLETQEFWIRVNKLTKEKKLTQIKLCEKCNIALPTYKGWIMRGIYPNAKQVVDMAKILETTPDFLVYG